MSKKLDLVGQKFNKLTVESFSCSKNGKSYWNCICDCGKKHIAKGSALKDGSIKSCGCYKLYTSSVNAKKMSKGNHKHNEIIIENGYAKIKMSNCEEFALIDIEDIPKIKDYCWWYHKSNFYPTAKVNGKNVKLHRIIMPNDNKELVTDHINRRKLDNRKCNLRIVTQCVNCQNTGIKITNKTGYKHISHISARNAYLVCFRKNHKYHYVGTYRDLETAVQKLEEYKKEHNL